jgi:hypothetical protein
MVTMVSAECDTSSQPIEQEPHAQLVLVWLLQQLQQNGSQPKENSAAH